MNTVFIMAIMATIMTTIMAFNIITIKVPLML